MNPSGVLPRPIVREIASFGTIGVASTLAYLALYSIFRAAAPPPVANALALAMTTVGNTAANRRWTFAVRGPEGLASDHAAGIVAFLIALGISSTALILLHVVAPGAGRPLELAVLLFANVLATLCRFIVLRSWFAARRPAAVARISDRPGR